MQNKRLESLIERPAYLKRQAELILRQAQDDGLLIEWILLGLNLFLFSLFVFSAFFCG
jgi:hypothetical protein